MQYRMLLVHYPGYVQEGIQCKAVVVYYPCLGGRDAVYGAGSALSWLQRGRDAV